MRPVKTTALGHPDSGLFVWVSGLKAELLRSEPKGAYSKLSFRGAEPNELHHQGTVRLAQPVTEMHHGSWTINATMRLVRYNILKFESSFSNRYLLLHQFPWQQIHSARTRRPLLFWLIPPMTSDFTPLNWINTCFSLDVLLLLGTLNTFMGTDRIMLQHLPFYDHIS